ncbi:MAG: Mov34/MPN/PAD-1 family protein [Candidatus Diapherotrites archaeon]|nr:Mov34/MPN/PAD-1 family protein [Candidatus Diapherotrites archaeon]
MYSIKKEVLGAIIEASKNTFPEEFIGVLGGNIKNKIIDELIVVPATFGTDFSAIHTHLLPMDQKIIGTIHSHPSTSSRPSQEDLNAFGKLGQVHIIIAKPFEPSSMKCFDSKGNTVKLKITG